MPSLFDNNSFEQWQAEGAQDATERALSMARQMLNEYEEPALNEATNDALLDYIARREREIPEDKGLNETY